MESPIYSWELESVSSAIFLFCVFFDHLFPSGQNLTYSRLALNAISNQGWPWTLVLCLHFPVLGLQVCITRSSSHRVGDPCMLVAGSTTEIRPQPFPCFSKSTKLQTYQFYWFTPSTTFSNIDFLFLPVSFLISFYSNIDCYNLILTLDLFSLSFYRSLKWNLGPLIWDFLF